MTDPQPARLIPCDVCAAPISTKTVPGQRHTYIDVHRRWHDSDDKSRNAIRSKLIHLEAFERTANTDLAAIRTEINNIDIPTPPEALEIADSDEWPDDELEPTPDLDDYDTWQATDGAQATETTPVDPVGHGGNVSPFSGLYSPAIDPNTGMSR